MLLISLKATFRASKQGLILAIYFFLTMLTLSGKPVIFVAMKTSCCINTYIISVANSESCAETDLFEVGLLLKGRWQDVYFTPC